MSPIVLVQVPLFGLLLRGSGAAPLAPVSLRRHRRSHAAGLTRMRLVSVQCGCPCTLCRGGSKSKFEPKHDVVHGSVCEVLGPGKIWQLGVVTAIGVAPGKNGKWRVLVSCPTQLAPKTIAVRAFAVAKHQLKTSSVQPAGASAACDRVPP